MKEKKIIRLCLIGFIIGTILLYVSIVSIEIPLSNIGEISESKIGTIAKVRGTIEDLKINKDNHHFFNLRDDTGKIKIVVFANSGFEDWYLIENGATAEITGTVELYRNSLEIIPIRNQVFIEYS